MNKIPLLRFPFLVIQHVISIMCPFEIIHMAKVSKKTKNMVKTILNSKLHNKYQAEVYISEDYGIDIKSGNNRWYYVYTSKPECLNSVTFTDETGDYSSTMLFQQNFTLNKLEDFQRIGDLCHDIFGGFKEIDIEIDNPDNQAIIDFLRPKQESFERCQVLSKQEKGEEIKYLLETFKITKNLLISSKISENSEISLPENVETLFIEHSKFMNLEQLLALKSKQIMLISTKFTNQDISVLLKRWMSSESLLNLERLRIGFNSNEANNILEDIPNEVGEEFRFDEDFGGMNLARSGPDIRREDGKKARVVFWRGADGMILDMYIH